MARISTYDRDLVISRDDILIGTDKDNSNITRNFSVGSLVDFITLDSGGITNTNYYLSSITANSDTGLITFVVEGADDQTLTLGTAAFKSASDFAEDDISFNTAQVVSENDITAYYLNVSGNGTNGQLLASDGDGSFSWVDAANITDTNFYLDGITKDGNVLTFSVNGASNQSFTFGSAAFESVASIITQLSSDLSLDDIDTSTLGDLSTLDKVDANQIESDAITKLKIKNEAVTEEKLKVSNNPTSGYVLTSDGSDGFTWAANSASNYYLDGVTRNNETLTFSLAGGGTDVTFTYGNAAFKDVESTVTGRNAAKIPRADHTHSMSHVTDAGDLATLDSVGTSDIDDDAITAGKLSAAVGTNGQVLALDSSLNLVWTAAGAGATNFLALSDTPSSYTANAGDILKVNSGTNGLEFADFKVSNINHFTTVNTGTAGKVLAVDVNNDGSTNYKGLKWVDTSQVGATTFTALTDTPSALGSAHQVLTVNAAGTDLEFRAIDDDSLPDGIVTTDKIAADAVTAAKLPDNVIAQEHIADNAVGSNQIAGNAVVEGKIGTGAVTEGKIGATAVTTAKIANDAVTKDKVASDLRAVNQIGADDGDYIDFVANTKMDFYVNAGNEMRLEADGDLHVDGDVIAFSTTIASDKNLKNDIQNITNPIDKIKKLNGVTFNWARNGKASGGVIAQDVQESMPSLVSSVQELNDTSSHLAVDYNGIIGLLIETVKEQQSQIDTLKAQLQA